MIKLSGLELGKDIQIKVTGLRPGEKMYEELFYESEILIPTINKKLSEHKKYGILPKEALIEKLISYSDTFKLIHNDYVQNKEDINCGKDYIEELKSTNNSD